MIKSFLDKGLAELFSTSRTSRIDKRLHQRIITRLDTLNDTTDIDELAALPGYDFHALKGLNPKRYTIHVNGPWCITFEFEGGDAYRLNFEQYH